MPRGIGRGREVADEPPAHYSLDIQVPVAGCQLLAQDGYAAVYSVVGHYPAIPDRADQFVPGNQRILV
jgi:hypothetical protein